MTDNAKETKEGTSFDYTEESTKPKDAPLKRNATTNGMDENHNDLQNNTNAAPNSKRSKTFSSSTMTAPLDDTTLEIQLDDWWNNVQSEEEFNKARLNTLQNSTKIIDEMIRMGLSAFYKMEALDCENRKLQQMLVSKDVDIKRMKLTEEESRSTINVSLTNPVGIANSIPSLTSWLELA
jgi:hypothetical protein